MKYPPAMFYNQTNNVIMDITSDRSNKL